MEVSCYKRVMLERWPLLLTPVHASAVVLSEEPFVIGRPSGTADDTSPADRDASPVLPNSESFSPESPISSVMYGDCVCLHSL